MTGGRFALLLCWALAWPGLAAGNPAESEIEYLLGFVETSGCTFTRNGTAHTSADAADHLRMKYRRGRRYAKTAEQFIDNLASKSSWTGERYTVDCGGEVAASGDWLHEALANYRAAPD